MVVEVHPAWILQGVAVMAMGVSMVVYAKWFRTSKRAMDDAERSRNQFQALLGGPPVKREKLERANQVGATAWIAFGFLFFALGLAALIRGLV
jgi:hypothetical protein